MGQQVPLGALLRAAFFHPGGRWGRWWEGLGREGAYDAHSQEECGSGFRGTLRFQSEAVGLHLYAGLERDNPCPLKKTTQKRGCKDKAGV